MDSDLSRMSAAAQGARLDRTRLPMRRPLVAIAVALALGIALQGFFPGGAIAGGVIAGALTLAAAGLALARKGGALRYLLWLLAFLALGVWRGEFPDHPRRPLPRSDTGDARWVITAQARSGWEELPDRARLELEVLATRPPTAPIGTETPARARLRLTVIRPAAGDRGAGASAPPPACPRVLPGDRLWALATLRVPRWVRDPGVPDWGRALERRGIDWVGTTASCADLAVEARPAGVSLARTVERARRAWREFVTAQPAPEADRGLLLALTTGERGLLPTPLEEAFQISGLAHILAISGLNLAFVALGLYWLLWRGLVRIPALALRLDARRLAAACVIPAAIFYTLLADAQLPAVRSCLMVIGFLVAILLGRASDPLQTLAASAILTLALWPQALYEVSFQLSYVAVAAIVLAVPPLCRLLRIPLGPPPLEAPRWKRALVRLGQFQVVSLAATIGTAPLLALHFNQLSLIGLLANLLAVPLSAWFIVPLGLAAATLLPLWAAGAIAIARIDLVLCGWLGSLAEGFAGCTGALLHLATPSPLQVVLAYGALLLMLHLDRRWARWAAAFALALLLAIGGAGRLSAALSDDLRVTVLDVGQGDAILVEAPGGKTLLVDAGPARPGGLDSGRAIVAPVLWGRGITRLDALALTHPEGDHMGGLGAVVRLFRPAELWISQPLPATPAGEALARDLARAGTRLRLLHAGDRPWAVPGVALEVCWPPEAAAAAGLDANQRSLVLRVGKGRQAVLLTGDLEGEGEQALSAREGDLSAAVLKVGHHGSAQATGEALLERVRPRVAVISAGAGNRYHFPHPAVLERLEAAAARVLLTAQAGAVTITTDGTALEIETVSGLRWTLDPG